MEKRWGIAVFSAFILILLFPKASIAGAAKAMDAWLSIVLPSLFPFFVVTTLCNATNFIPWISKLFHSVISRIFHLPGCFSYIWLVSALSGYPMGARLTGECFQTHLISKKEASAIINATSLSGPLFMVGSVCIGMLGAEAYAPYLLIPHYLSSLILAVGIGRISFPHVSNRSFVIPNMPKKSISDQIADAISSGMNAMLLICGFMMLYSVLLSCIAETHFFSLFHGKIAKPLCSGFFEMTTGCLATKEFPLSLRIILLNGIIAFGGLSIQGQTKAVASKYGITLQSFFLCKLLQALLCAGIAWVLIIIFPLSPATILS